MRRIVLADYNGRWDDRGVLQRLRRKLQQSAILGECIIVDGEEVEGLSPLQVNALLSGLPWEKIRPVGIPALRPCPLPVGYQWLPSGGRP